MGPKLETPRVPEVEQLLNNIESFQNGEFGQIKIDLTTLINHSHWVDAGVDPEVAQNRLFEHNIDFIAVLEKSKPIGICSRTQLGNKLGNRYQTHYTTLLDIKECLSEHPLQVTCDDSIVSVLISAFNRDEEGFYDDVVLTCSSGEYLGLISMKSLLILQNWVFMENIKQLKEQTAVLNQQKKQMQKNMSLARQLQQAMFSQQYPSFPSHRPEGQSMLKFHHTYFSPDILGGDFFHIVYLSDYRAGLFMCDVLGHNVSSALITSMLRALVASYRSIAYNPGKLLSKVNHKFIELLQHYPETMYATANYIVVDLEKALFTYASAGHPVPIKLNSRKGTCGQLEVFCQKNGPPLGILKDMVYETATGELSPGDLFLTYTDGLFEVFDRNNQQFGIARLVESFSKYLDKPPRQIFQDVIHDIEQFSEHKTFTDDVCLVGLEVAELLEH
jgi:serine phosphatase RsbU (regulator of sigma subunit)